MCPVMVTPERPGIPICERRWIQSTVIFYLEEPNDSSVRDVTVGLWNEETITSLYRRENIRLQIVII